MMSNLIYDKSNDNFKDQSTGGDYTKGTVDTVYSHLFPKRNTAVSYFNNNPDKQMAESKVYRPDLYEPGKLLFLNKKKMILLPAEGKRLGRRMVFLLL